MVVFVVPSRLERDDEDRTSDHGHAGGALTPNFLARPSAPRNNAQKAESTHDEAIRT